MVKVGKKIFEELKSYQRLMKLVAGNEVELSKLLKGTATMGGKEQALMPDASIMSGDLSSTVLPDKRIS